MKDINSSQGGSTYPAKEDQAGTLKGVVVRNLGAEGRRIAIQTKDTSITVGPNVHSADYAFEPIPNENLTDGYLVGAEVELAPARNYQEVLTVTDFFPFADVRNFVSLGKPEWANVGEMSNKVVGSDEPRVKLGQSITTSELYPVEHAFGKYLFSLSLHHKGKVYHLAFDGLKHPARLTADLNYQLRKVIPGVVGYFSALPAPAAGDGNDQAGQVSQPTSLTLHLHVDEAVGDVLIPAYRIENYNEFAVDVGDSNIASKPVHINCELADHITVNHVGVSRTVPDGEFVTTYRDEVIPSASSLVNECLTMENIGAVNLLNDEFTWTLTIPKEQFKTYKADPRYSIALLQVNPIELAMVGLTLKEVIYKLPSGDRPADLLPISTTISQTVNDEVLTYTPFFWKKYRDFNPDLEIALVSDVLANPEPSKWQFGETQGETMEVNSFYDRDGNYGLIAIVAPPLELDDTALFRKATSDVTVVVKYKATTHKRHALDAPPAIVKHWDEIYQSLDDPIPLPKLTGDIQTNAHLVTFYFESGQIFDRGNPTFDQDGNIIAETNTSYQELIDKFGYSSNYGARGTLLSSIGEDTLLLGFKDSFNYDMVVNYPPTNITLNGFEDIIYVKGRPTNDLTVPLFVKGTILGGFDGAPLKHATTVEWEFSIVDGDLITPMDVVGLPVQGSLFKSVDVGFNKDIFEALEGEGLFLTIKLKARYPWLAEPVETTVQVPINTTVYIPEETTETTPLTMIATQLPEDVGGVEIYDLDSGETLLSFETLESIIQGDNGPVFEKAGIQLSVKGKNSDVGG